MTKNEEETPQHVLPLADLHGCASVQKTSVRIRERVGPKCSLKKGRSGFQRVTESKLYLTKADDKRKRGTNLTLQNQGSKHGA